MAKLKVPLLSLKAQGRLAKLFSLARRAGRNIIERRPIPTDARSPAQLFNRHMFTKCVDLWHLLSDTEKQEWESLARPRHMTGYAWFISQCLRPNPGIYLPLQGGTMSGNIDMAKNRLLNLPTPTDDQEAANKKYHDDHLPPGGYTEGARVYHNVNQSIETETTTYLAFNSEDYDTDDMHDPVTANSRLTCKTAGIYLITFHGVFASNSTNFRRCTIRVNGSLDIADFINDALATTSTRLVLTTLYQLAVNDYVEVRVYQNSGIALDMRYLNSYSPVFMAQRIG